MTDEELFARPPIRLSDVISPDAVPKERRCARFREDINSSYHPKRRAKKFGAEGSHGWRDILRKWDEQGGICALCPKTLNGGFHVDHIMPLSKGGSDWPENIQLTCPPCNIRKSNRISYPVKSEIKRS